MGRCHMATAVIDEKILVVGGRDYKDNPTNRVECFNAKKNKWFVYS
jgi:hypothetical protein